MKHHAVGTFRGRFTELDAQFDAATGTITDAENHPAITFASSSVASAGGALTVEGELTLKGVTKPVTARGAFFGPSKVAGWEGPDQEHIGMDLEITVDRRGFGVAFNNELLDGQLNLGWDVTLNFSLEFSAPLDGGDSAGS